MSHTHTRRGFSRIRLAHVSVWILAPLAVWLGNVYGQQTVTLLRSLIAESAEETEHQARETRLHNLSTRIPERNLLTGYVNHVDNAELSLEVTNPSGSRINLTGVRLTKDRSIELDPAIPFPPFATKLVYKTVLVGLPSDLQAQEIDPKGIWLEYLRAGSHLAGKALVNPYPIFSNQLMAQDPFRSQWHLPTLPFVEIDLEAKEIVFLPGRWTLSENVTVPSGYKLTIAPGFQVTLSNNAHLLTHSPIIANGTETEPIVFDADGGAGQGIAILQPHGESSLQHVIFRNLSAPAQGGWELTGAVTFYEAPVAISNSRFVNCRAEDSLNIVRSTFSIHETSFENAHFDGFDSDFNTGTITSSRFVECGNDCLDFSGSDVSLHGVKFQGAGDKAISIGEKSRVSGVDLTIQKSVVGIAAKDSSEFRGSNVRIESTATSLTAYQKKPEFSGGSIFLEDSRISGPTTIDRDALSSIVVNGVPLYHSGSS